MTPATAEILKRVAGALSSAGLLFQLGGSGLLHAIGLSSSVRDLDLVFPSGVESRVESALGHLVEGPFEFSAAGQEPGFVSDWRVQVEQNGVPLDLSGGVALRIDGRVVRLPFVLGASWDLDGQMIPLAPLGHWLLIYAIHNPARAALLRPLVPERDRIRMLAELGLPDDFC